jgi:hypothetical protein
MNEEAIDSGRGLLIKAAVVLVAAAMMNQHRCMAHTPPTTPHLPLLITPSFPTEKADATYYPILPPPPRFVFF